MRIINTAKIRLEDYFRLMELGIKVNLVIDTPPPTKTSYDHQIALRFLGRLQKPKKYLNLNSVIPYVLIRDRRAV